MAKKQQPKLSYAPNMGLIAGEAQVAASEAGSTNVGQSFVVGAATVFTAIKKDNAERDARMDAYENEIGGIVNTNQFEDPKNKQVIKGFLNTQRDEYIKLSKIYDKTKDRDAKDKMEEIKFSLVNLNDQIKVFNQDKLDYRTASDENQLASLKTYDRTGDDFFTTAFTNNAAFSVDERGDINFGINNNSYKYKDKAGKWESKNNIDESNLLKIYGDSYKEGGKGNAFNSGNVRRGIYNSFKNTGNSALQVFVTTDLTSDESSLSFEEQFASGELSKEVYAGFTAKKDGTYDTDWMFENKNGDVLRNKVSDYFTKVVEDGHLQGETDNQTNLEEYKAKQVNANTLAATKQQNATLTNQIKQEQLNKLQNPATIPVDYFPNASKTGRGGVIFKGVGESYNPTKSGLISIREDIQNGERFNLGNTAQATPDGKGGWNFQRYETLTKDIPDPNNENEIIPKGTVILSGGVVNYKTTDKLIVNELPRDFREFMPEQYKTAEQKKALELIEEAKNLKK